MRRPRLPDPAALARFYQALLGGEINRPDRWTLDADWMTLHPPGGPVLAFQRAADHRPPRWPDPDHPQQLHLDLGVPDLDAAERDALAAGARLLDPGPPGRGWRVYADPAGHPFCLVRQASA
ncbi:MULTISPECIES: VOC family protein [Streptomycetaceae]|uniref:VOC domain-containing protein n=1 Tax=Streptantibioticus cattleyicolor (strain ATCC 35852 / DSM 46488 / JCM 4925 / NBRC 14057 / NRRL 8057) TaxID=1003195 RepID=F8JPS9_STREN|nr:VOC family protein [Streptantibioticus cattleyicolor]AEW92778.1 hypothetical protein SCATT_04070 [Streptantibioticus cattleyicolor NRRL 8057 = DSM 46488]MYS57541.1 glyoxalase/bleomycin resistance/dioxygenase family protein [Streptomyces sp. SID5468]CCB73133.1 conserved protein of unknown function [Streptantibioticus cattleyicolor NRRL 8057 = DSM 46488]